MARYKYNKGRDDISIVIKREQEIQEMEEVTSKVTKIKGGSKLVHDPYAGFY